MGGLVLARASGPGRRSRLRLPLVALSVGALVLTSCTATPKTSGAGPSPSSGAGVQGAAADFGTEYENTGTGPMVDPTIPETPSVGTYLGALQCGGGNMGADVRKPAPQGCTRVFTLTALELTQKIANFPLTTAKVWGYQAPGVAASSPGPTLVSYGDEKVQIKVVNLLPEPTTIHPHGLHQPNESDGVAGVSQPNPIPAGSTYAYPPFTPGHVGTFAYHSHFDGAVQEMRGLDGFFVVLPRQEHQSVKVDKDVLMVLQIWAWTKDGELVKPFGIQPGNMFPFDTINGKTGDASGGPINIDQGNRVRIRFYNASQQTHAMHLHGHDEVVVSKNGHAEPQVRETTQTVTPGDFYEIEFSANNPGNWIFHCHFPHHTANKMSSGFNGAPVGMTRIFHYNQYAPVPPQYFTDAHFMSKTLS